MGGEIEPEYWRMAARYLKAQNSGLLAPSRLIFEEAGIGKTTCTVGGDRRSGALSWRAIDIPAQAPLKPQMNADFRRCTLYLRLSLFICVYPRFR